MVDRRSVRVKVIIVLVAGWLAFQWLASVRSHRAPPAKPRQEAMWMTDVTAALAKARSEHKTVLIDFTGSDWCGWCIKLDEEVFATQEFVDYAEKNLVLLKIDFPQKRKQPPAEQQQNERLAHQYGVTGFPTIVVLKSTGEEKGRLGYRPGGPAVWLSLLKSLP
jgi:protein disulfide-isomerase